MVIPAKCGVGLNVEVARQPERHRRRRNPRSCGVGLKARENRPLLDDIAVAIPASRGVELKRVIALEVDVVLVGSNPRFVRGGIERANPCGSATAGRR